MYTSYSQSCTTVLVIILLILGGIATGYYVIQPEGIMEISVFFGVVIMFLLIVRFLMPPPAQNQE
jgi:uncharacterized membrane protein